MNRSNFPYDPEGIYTSAATMQSDDAWIGQFDDIELASDGAAVPSQLRSGASPFFQNEWAFNWREPSEDLRRLRARNVLLIDRMLRAHQPHDVLTQVPENTNWHSKTITVALKIERLMFTTASSRQHYEDEATLRSRVQLLSRQLVRMRKRKNVVAGLVYV